MRTSTSALKRAGIAAVAVVTVGAGLPALLSTAASAQQATPSLTVSSDGTTNTNRCETFTVTRQGADGTATPTATITVTEVANSGTGNITFCSPTTGAAVGGDSTAGDGTAQLVVSDTGQSFTFGLFADNPVSADVLVTSNGFTSGATRADFQAAATGGGGGGGSPAPGSGTASPSATPTTTMSPRPTTSPNGGNQPSTPPGCARAAEVMLRNTTINATGRAGVSVTATPNSFVELLAYTRPSTQFRVVRSGTTDANGSITFADLRPPANTRLRAQQRGCAFGQDKVLNVRTQLSLNVVRNGTRNYTFSGRAIPARNGGLIVSLYRVTNDGRQILTSQTRANASNGSYVINRRFTGSGRFGFVVRTGQDLQNAPGTSNVRSLLVF